MRASGRMNRARVLLGGVAALASVGALAGCDLQENADLDRGEQLFTQKCGSCHTLTAAGTNADVGPSLDLAFAAARSDGMDQDTIEGVVQTQIENPRPASPDDPKVYMPANLVEGEDAEAVAAYVASVAGVPGIEPPDFVAPEFFAANCGGCHTLGVAGTTGTIGPNLDEIAGQSPDQVGMSITDPEAQIAAGFPGGVMPQNYGETLTPEQLQQLVAFILGQEGGSAGGGGAGGGGK